MTLHFNRRALLFAAVATCSTLCAPDVVAWGDEGHEIVATIAYSRLTPAVRQKVDAMLFADTDTLTARDFVSRATWADRYRDSDRSTTKEHYNATQNWHFVDIELDAGDVDTACSNHPQLPPDTPASAGQPKDCVVDKIDQFTAELRDPQTSANEKLLALKFLIHFVGDVHQPLHSADHEDRGGNQVAVRYAKLTKPSNLHSYWDTYLVQKLGKDPKTVGAALNKKITKAMAAEWSKDSPTTWAQEAFEQAKDVAYNFDGEKTFTDDHGGDGEQLDTAYDARALPVVREQLSKAGVRLAALLNASL
jgi:hypothetical protein